MSLIRYNGVQMGIVRERGFQSRAVMTPDGADYLYTHFLLSARCVCNLGATQANQNLGVSLESLKRSLALPRKPLLFAVGGATVLKSPPKIGGAEAACDANNGPRVIGVNVVEIHGTKTAFLDFDVETWLVDAGQPANPVIGHRWEPMHDISRYFLTTRTINGIVVCRSDVLALTNLVPDDFRKAVFHPIPTNFMRRNVNVRQASDGLTYYYSFTDEEQWLNLASPILEIDGEYGEGYDATGYSGWALPTFDESFRIRVVGRRGVDRSVLINAAASAAASRGFNDVAGQKTVAFRRARLSHHLFRNEVTLDVATIAGNFVGGAGAVFGLIGGDMNRHPNEIPGVATSGEGVNTAPPGSNVRGGYLAACIAQALTSPGAKPATPAEPRRAKNAT